MFSSRCNFFLYVLRDVDEVVVERISNLTRICFIFFTVIQNDTFWRIFSFRETRSRIPFQISFGFLRFLWKYSLKCSLLLTLINSTSLLRKNLNFSKCCCLNLLFFAFIYCFKILFFCWIDLLIPFVIHGFDLCCLFDTFFSGTCFFYKIIQFWEKRIERDVWIRFIKC